MAVALSLAGQTPGVFPPLDVRVPVPPRPFVAGGLTHLVHEFHIANLSSRRATIDAVDVRDRAAAPDAPAMIRLDGDALGKALHVFGANPDEAGTRVLPGGRAALMFVWLKAPAGALPAGLTHRFALRLAGGGAGGSSNQADPAPAAGDIAAVVNGVDVRVSREGTPVIGPPLTGDHWLAANGPGNETGHRRALLAPLPKSASRSVSRSIGYASSKMAGRSAGPARQCELPGLCRQRARRGRRPRRRHAGWTSGKRP